jgi:ElaB/YqjD/DUF883 family membrane-anchored ribosome-binding protein
MAITPNQLTRTNGQSLSDRIVIADDPEAIRLQIQRTRAQMGGTIDEIQKRLSPDYIKQQTQDALRDAAVEKVEQMTQTAEDTVNNWRSNAMEMIKDNPVPTALVGIGLGWLLLANREKDDYDYEYSYERDYYGNRPLREPYRYSNITSQSRYAWDAETGYGRERYATGRDQSDFGEAVDDAQEWVEDTAEMAQRKAQRAASAVSDKAEAAVSSVRQSVDDITDSTQHYASDVADEAQRRAADARLQARLAAEQAQRELDYRMRQTKKTFWKTMEENPLAIGIAALAAGALVGMIIPGTRRENELMGETRDQLFSEAGSTVQETMRKAQTVVERTAETAVDEAKRQAEKQNLTMADASKSLSGNQSKGNSGTTTGGSTTGSNVSNSGKPTGSTTNSSRPGQVSTTQQDDPNKQKKGA